MSPRQGNIRLRLLAVAVAVCALIGALPPAASADEVAVPTTQARAYNADWVPYLDPPEKPAAVCLVDSGVNVTPDTPADSPDGPIVKRLALDGGPGTAAGSSWEALHGTRMAMVGAAPINGWGAVGFWPGVRIVSIRAMPVGETSFPFQTYADALFMCGTWAASYNVAAVNLSLACTCQPTTSELAILNDRIVRSHANGMSVVAAVGNRGGSVSSPADQDGVFGIAAGGRFATLCPFSNHGVGTDAMAAGCDLDLADPEGGALWSGYEGGTSAAAVSISALLALLRSYRPSLKWNDAERLVSDSINPTDGAGAVDVDATFRAAGLGDLIERARARMPKAATDDTTASDAPTGSDAHSSPNDAGSRWHPALMHTVSQLPRPALSSIKKRRGLLGFSTQRIPAGAKLAIWLQRRETQEFGYRTVRHFASSVRRVAVRLPRKWRGGRLAVRFIARRNLASSFAYHRVPR